MSLKSFAGAAAALALTAIGGAAHAADLGACVWQNFPASGRSQVLAAYQTDPKSAGALLKTMDRQVQAAGAVCGAGGGMPVLWVRTALIAEAIQTSMADALQDARGLDRRRLDEVWANAAPDVKDCARVAGAKAYRLPPPACSTPGAPILLAQQLGIPITTRQRPVIDQALLYYAAKGSSEYANALVERFNHRG